MASARSGRAQLLTEVGLGDSLKKKAAELSRGMHQKAQLIATIINDPDLLIVDEPFQGLDPVNAEMLKGVLLEQRDRGAAVVMSTHDMGDAQTLCDRILLIDKGRRLLYGTRGRGPRRVQRRRRRGRGHDSRPTRRAAQRASTRPRPTASVRYLLREGMTAQDLFRELAATAAPGRALRGRGPEPQ